MVPVSYTHLDVYKRQTFTSGKTLFFIGGTWWANLESADGFEWNYTYCPAFEGYENSVATPTGCLLYTSRCV